MANECDRWQGRMTTVIVICEGQTELAFVRTLLQPHLAHEGIYMEPRLISTSRKAKGGALEGQRVRRYSCNVLKERKDTYVTTFFDMYGLPMSFPGHADVPSLADPLDRAMHIETAFHKEVIREVNCRHDRFLPHIQPYEFEALLFSDIEAIEKAVPSWRKSAAWLAEARHGFISPEHINDGLHTHPSARLKQLRPKFKKVAHGVAISSHIGLRRMRAECRHFDRWLNGIEALAVPASR